MTSRLRRSVSFHVLPMEKVPLVFILALCMECPSRAPICSEKIYEFEKKATHERG